MFNSEKTKITGKVNVLVTDKDGKVKEDFTVPNLVVTAGLDYIASRIKEATATAMSHMAVGTDTTAAALGDTTLGTEVAGARVTLDSTVVAADDNNVVYSATFPAGTGTAALTEAGIFNASSSGTMLCRTVFSVINKAAADSMTVTWTITIS